MKPKFEVIKTAYSLTNISSTSILSSGDTEGYVYVPYIITSTTNVIQSNYLYKIWLIEERKKKLKKLFDDNCQS